MRRTIIFILLAYNACWAQSVFPPPAGGGGGGGVSSVSVTSPSSIFAESGCTITTSGTCALSFATAQTANLIIGSNSSGDLGLMSLTTAQLPSAPAISAANMTSFPTLNQNTTGSAATFTGSLVGDVTGTQGATVVALLNGVAFGTAVRQDSSAFSLQGGYLSNTYTAGAGGVTAGHLVQFDSSANVIAATNGYGGIAKATASAASSVEIARLGISGCIFENTAVIGDIAIPGTADKTECRDSGATSSTSVPSTTPVIGLVQTSASAGASANVRLHGIGVFGTQVPVSQVTGLATVATSGLYTDLSGKPTLPANTTAVSHNFFSAYNSTTGAYTQLQPASTDLSDAASLATLTGTQTLTNKSISAGQITGLAASATTDTTNATNVSSGTLGAARLPAALSSSTSVNGTSIPSGVTLTQTIASGTAALGTGAIASAACATAVTATATGTLTTDVVTASFNGDPTAVTGYVPSTSGMLTIFAYPTANTFNAKVCNNTSASITPGAITLNWRVAR